MPLLIVEQIKAFCAGKPDFRWSPSLQEQCRIQLFPNGRGGLPRWGNRCPASRFPGPVVKMLLGKDGSERAD